MMFLKKDITCRFFVHDNRMLAERAFYCLRQWDGIVKKIRKRRERT